jgi:hypothetical protein
MWFKKKIEVPVSNETQIVESIQLWYVRWTSRYGNFSGETKKEIEAFPTESEANDFATALRNAFKLVRHTSDVEVIVERAR